MEHTRLAIFSSVVAICGLPLYLQLPHFATKELGFSLGFVSAAIVFLRGFDMIQDIFIGKVIDQFDQYARSLAIIGGLMTACGLWGVFAWRVDANQKLVFVLSGLIMFSGYSLLYILLYRYSSQSNRSRPQAVREIFMQIGLVIGAALPLVLSMFETATAATFGLILAFLITVATWLSLPLWQNKIEKTEGIVRRLDSNALRIIALFFFNTLPIAITSTLFYFFVEDVLKFGKQSEMLIIVFFAATIFGIALASVLQKFYALRSLLLWAMSASILAFFWAFFMGEGAIIQFLFISLASGVSIGIEIFLLPFALSHYLRKQGLPFGLSFGIWSFLTKFALVIGVLILIPLHGWAGFRAGESNTQFAITALAASYALLPCAIKFGSIIVLFSIPKETFQ